MLINITFINDLPDVEAKLIETSKILRIQYKSLVNASYKEICEYSKVTTVIFCNPNKIKFKFDNDFFERFPSLRCICTASTGTVHIDLPAAHALGVKIISIKSDQDILPSITSTADLALTLALTGLRKSYQSAKDFADHGLWDFERYIGRQIKDIRACIFGYGRLGKIMSGYLTSLGAQVDAVDPKFTFDFRSYVSELYSQKLKDYDLISLHLHAEENEIFFSDEFFAGVNDRAVIVNTSRGEIIDTERCLTFLEDNPDATYLTDVISDESSLESRQRLLDFCRSNHNLIVTQHIGGMSLGARRLAFGRAADKLLTEAKRGFDA